MPCSVAVAHQFWITDKKTLESRRLFILVTILYLLHRFKSSLAAISGRMGFMKSIQQDYVINAPVSAVWKALTDGPIAEQWGAAPAKVDVRVGGEFSYWGGDIHGVFTKLVSEKLIEQDWYGHDNPTWKYQVSFVFEGNDKTTTIHMAYSGNILDEQKDVADWRDYYFGPIKKLLEK